MYLESIYNENILVNIKDLNKYLKQNNNINDYLLEILKKKIGNKCNNDGLVISDSINIIYRDTGTFRYNDKILYKIKFNTQILFPSEGCILNNCKIVFISSILYIAKIKSSNLIIILPRNFIKTPIDIKKNKYINVLCLDKYYELNDSFMFIIGIPYYDSLNIEKISNTSLDDNICKNIFTNITEFKKEYENLFNKINDDEEEELLITYEITQTDDEINNILLKFIENLNLYIENNEKTINYKVNTSNLNNYKNILDIYDLLNIPIISINKFNLYTNIDLYLENKNKLQFNTFINTNNSFTINNSYANCYIISSIQLLKNNKLFLRMFYDLMDKNENSLDKDNFTYKFYVELNKLFNGYIDTLDIFVGLLEEYNDLYKLNFNLSGLNNVNDFISFLFNILDNTIDTNLYIKNVYDDININIRSIQKTNTENNIGYYINTINTSNNASVLNKFYNISVCEYKCSSCLFRYYHIKNKLICNLVTNNNDNISKCIHSLNMNPELILGLECNVCSNTTIYKSEYLYMNPTDYLLCNINRIVFNNILEKNTDELFINNRINIKIVDTNSSNFIKTNNYTLDLKSVICHIGTLSNGHYICLNKTSSDFFYLYDDSHKYIVTHDKFYINNLFKSNVCNLVYQLNSVNSPLSDILLLEYENEILNENITGSFNDYIKNNNILGVNIKTQMSGGSQVTNIEDFENILVKLYNLNLTNSVNDFISIINKYYKDLDNIKLLDEKLLINTLTEFFDTNVSIILPSYEDFYKTLIQKYVSNLKNSLINKEIDFMDFLNGTSLYNNIPNIYIGSAGYNTNKTNHWDVIYEISNNNLELYAEHFNTVEINDTYYNDYDIDYWKYLEDTLSELEENIAVSIIFNKELSNIIINNNNLNNDDLKIMFNKTFRKYYDEKISLIDSYIHNIVFIFESNFKYNEENLDKLKLFTTINSEYSADFVFEPNFVFEFQDNSWFNNTVSTFLSENNLNMATLILNNENNDYGYNLSTNIEFMNTTNLDIKYIKLYGSISKYNGSHNNDLLLLINIIMNNNNNSTSISKLLKNGKSVYIYFNNIETDLDNKRYKTNINDLDLNSKSFLQNSLKDNETKNDEIKDDETKDDKIKDNDLEIYSSIESSETMTENLNIPSAVFDAKCLYKLLEKLNNLKK